jgi:uncharacterized protein (UPF0262 family)
MTDDPQTPDRRDRLIDITLDEASISHNAPEVQQERKVAIFDLLEDNTFTLDNGTPGPFRLHLEIVENRLAFHVAQEDGAHAMTFLLSLSPFRKLIKDYFLVCESYYAAIKTEPPSRIEALDMGRRGLHNEGTQLLQQRLKGKIDVDFDTARRLFTLICALHWKG